MNEKIEIQNKMMENQIEKHNSCMSVDIDIEVMETEIKNEKCSYWKLSQKEIKLNQNISMSISIAA